MNTIGFLNMRQKKIQCLKGIYLKIVKINVENLSEFPVTFYLFLPVVLGINGIIASTFIGSGNISIIECNPTTTCGNTIFVCYG